MIPVNDLHLDFADFTKGPNMKREEAFYFLQRRIEQESIVLRQRMEMIDQYFQSGADADDGAAAIAMAIESFGGETDAYAWLNTPHHFLNGATPLDSILTGLSERVRELLTAINYGTVG